VNAAPRPHARARARSTDRGPVPYLRVLLPDDLARRAGAPGTARAGASPYRVGGIPM